MDIDPDENPFPNHQNVLTGEERDRLVERVLETTDLRRIDRYVREQGYERAGERAYRDLLPEYSFITYRISLQYNGGDDFATANWTGIHPDTLDAGDLTYEEVYEETDLGVELADSSLDERDVVPLVVGFLENGAIGLSIGPDGIEETEVDWAEFADIAQDVSLDEDY